MQASWAARATFSTARTRPRPVEHARRPLHQRRRDEPAPAEGDVVRTHGDTRLADEPAVEAMTVNGAVVAARDEGLLTGERDVLRRCARGEDPCRTAPAAVDRDPPLRAGGDPGGAAVGREPDVVSEERRRERPDELRTPWVGRVEHGDAGGSGAERRPQRPAVGAHGDMPRRSGNPRSPQHVRALGVHGDDFLASGVRDVGERPPWMDGRVARRLEAVELCADTARRGVEQRQDAVFGVSDDGDRVVHRLDAPRPRPRADPADDAGRLQVEHDDVALEIRCDERDRRAAGERSRGKRDGQSGPDELSSVHAFHTRVGGRKVQGTS